MIVKELINHNNIVLHNIDHHHDICYKDWQVSDIKRGRVTHACWVGNLLFERRLSKYYWYKNDNSKVLSVDNFGGNILFISLSAYIFPRFLLSIIINNYYNL